jgi:hypothetical protein
MKAEGGRMPTKAQILMIAALTALATGPAAAQSRKSAAVPSAKDSTVSSGEAKPETLKILRAVAEALGMLRFSDIGSGNTHLPAVDAVTTMEIWGSGTTVSSGQPYKTDYHAAIDYRPAAMRLELTRTNANAAPVHTIQVVRGNDAWDESEIGGGLVPGKGTATPELAAVRSRMLQLWILPYGVVKAALAAGEKTAVSAENGATVVTFPLSGELAGVTVKATLDAKNEVAKVETHSDDPALSAALLEAEYSGYADHGEILTDVKSPGHIVQKKNGQVVLDIQVKMVDANNPYLVFPVPENVKQAAAH